MYLFKSGELHENVTRLQTGTRKPRNKQFLHAWAKKEQNHSGSNLKSGFTSSLVDLTKQGEDDYDGFHRLLRVLPGRDGTPPVEDFPSTTSLSDTGTVKWASKDGLLSSPSVDDIQKDINNEIVINKDDFTNPTISVKIVRSESSPLKTVNQEDNNMAALTRSKSTVPSNLKVQTIKSDVKTDVATAKRRISIVLKRSKQKESDCSASRGDEKRGIDKQAVDDTRRVSNVTSNGRTPRQNSTVPSGGRSVRQNSVAPSIPPLRMLSMEHYKAPSIIYLPESPKPQKTDKQKYLSSKVIAHR